MADIATDLDRVGHGRWNIIMRPTIGTLWVTDAGLVGFQAGPRMDPAPVLALMQNALDAGKDGNVAFDELVAAFGSPSIKVGDLGFWREDRTPLQIPRVDRG